VLAPVLALAAPGAGMAQQGFEREVSRFVAEMSARHGFEQAELARLLDEARVLENVLAAIARPAERKPWYEYRPIFVTGSRTQGGVEFWRRHRATLARAHEVYGVAPEYVVAIIGVETRYGANTGRIRVLDSLTTLAFGYPRRASFFRSELEHFLLLAREEGLDVRRLEGSYAGAMGLPQFISSSYRRYAVDFDGDRVRDLLTNPSDAIGSVANYLAEHGWRRGAPVAVRADGPPGKLAALAGRGIKPHTPLSDLTARGVRLVDTAAPGIDPSARAAVVALETRAGPEHRPEHWVVLGNFYTITRYNHSALYAMAVHQLAEAIRARFDAPAHDP